MVRVIAGTAKGKQLIVPETGTRAVTDRIKTVVFDLLREFIEGASVLDLFAGSGSYGIEALSRGAVHATFVDNGQDAVSIIKTNLRNCELINQATVIHDRLPRALEQLAGQHFDLIFCDPPFDRLNKFNLQDYKQIITDQNLFCIRLPSEFDIARVGARNFTIAYEKKLGLSTIYFLRAELL